MTRLIGVFNGLPPRHLAHSLLLLYPLLQRSSIIATSGTDCSASFSWSL